MTGDVSLAYQKQPDETVAPSLASSSSATVETFSVLLPPSTGDNVLAHVNMRPGVLEFLRNITSTYETHIFTAATSVYANAVLDHLCASVSPSSCDIFTARWFREDCTWDNQHGVYVKDLSKLPLELHKTVLVDNNPFSFLTQPENGIFVNSFYADGNDATLPAVRELIEQLDGVEDVRPLLSERFQLAAQLEVLTASLNESQQAATS